jgi:hypothetical protein
LSQPKADRSGGKLEIFVLLKKGIVNMNKLIKNNFIPLDKSWIIRMGILDIIHGKKDINNFLAKQKNLSDDLLALKRVTTDWNKRKAIDVGESGTLFRFLQFVSWKQKLNKKFIIKGTLAKRKITDNPKIINLSQSQLLKLDNQTSQWASVSALCGDKKRLKNAPYKLKLTYKAIEHWNKQRKKGKKWIPRYDETILAQAETYLKLLNRKKVNFSPRQAEDYCFAFTFGYITKKEGEKRWPSLKGHESNRIKEMSEMLDSAKKRKAVTSKDHRVVQAIAMWGKINNKQAKILYPNAVKKSWPQFWDFLKFVQKLN